MSYNILLSCSHGNLKPVRDTPCRWYSCTHCQSVTRVATTSFSEIVIATAVERIHYYQARATLSSVKITVLSSDAHFPLKSTCRLVGKLETNPQLPFINRAAGMHSLLPPKVFARLHLCFNSLSSSESSLRCRRCLRLLLRLRVPVFHPNDRQCAF